MRPIGNNSGVEATGVAAPDGLRAVPENASAKPNRIRSSHSGRFEDIIGAVPVRATTLLPEPSAAENPASPAFNLPEAIERIIASSNSLQSVKQSFAELLHHQMNCCFVGWSTFGSGKIGEPSAIDRLAGNEEISDDCAALCKAAAIGGSTMQQPMADRVISVSPVRGGSGDSLVVIVPTHNAKAVASAVDLMGSRLSELLVTDQLRQSVTDSLNSAALVELISLVTSESSRKAALQRLADELQRHLSAEEVFVGVCPNTQPACRLTAVSNSPEFDRFAETTRLADAVMQESIARAAASVWPASEDSNRHALLAHQQFADHRRVASVTATPLRSESGDIVGSIVATFDDVGEVSTKAMRFLNAGSRAIGTSVKSINRAHQSQLDSWKSKLSKLLGSQKFTTVCIAVCLAAAAMLIPMDYRVKCETELQPVSRRYIAAPFDAPLEKCHVDPGDIVEKNQVLATLDGRELRWEAAGLRADIGKANKEHNSFLSQQEFGDAAIARHEMDRLTNRSELLAQRVHNLEIRSPVSGVVVAGDLRETEGVPLEMGQSLFEVAPLDRLVLEVFIPEEDIRHVGLGMTIRLRLDSRPSETVEATVLRIHPKAELREHQNVFVAEAEISNQDLLLRPGMKGTSLISTGRRAVGWNLFHKPVAHVIGWLGW